MDLNSKLGQLIYELVRYWSSFGYFPNKEIYIDTLANTLVPKLRSPRRSSDNMEQSLVNAIKSELSSADWSSLPELIGQYQIAIKNEFEESISKIKREREEQARQKLEEFQRSEEECKAKEKKLEQKRQELIRRNNEKNALLQRLKGHFRQDFIGAYEFFSIHCTGYISPEEYESEKVNFVESWVKQHLDATVQREQAIAIAAVENHIQVEARAGSGKTRTIINRCLFLQKHCGIAPGQILLLAFNRKAAEEMRERFASHLQSNIPHVLTFHGLAYALVRPEESILKDDPDGEQSKSRTLQEIIDTYIQNPVSKEEVRILMMAHFREDWERIAFGGYNKSPEEILKYSRSLIREGIDGKYYKSSGEKLIADFLFEHDIKFKYERNFWWNGINYRPDFTIVKENEESGIVIEYFGLKGDPEYDEMSDEKRDYWRKKPNWCFLEFSPSHFRHGASEGFCASLKESLEGCGITCRRLSEEEIWRRIKDRAIDRFTKVVTGFIQRCRKLSLSPTALAEIIKKDNCKSSVEEQFLPLAHKFYESYLKRLQATGEEDFDGLLQEAVKMLEAGRTVFRRKSGSGDLRHLRFVFIDEYQDFSELFHLLMEAIRKHNHQAHFFCVGDDWQAINSFAGSDLRFYKDFQRNFDPSRNLQLSRNYRSATSVVEIGNRLMKGLGHSARPDKTVPGMVALADLGAFVPTSKEQAENPGDIFTPAVLRLVSNAINDNSKESVNGKDDKESKEVVLLSRKNTLPWYINYSGQKKSSSDNDLDKFLEQIRSRLPEEVRNKVTISTTHKYKGLEKKTVIILDAVLRCYPLIHPDFLFTRIFGDNIDRIIVEERRLFYVALTRAIENLFILTDSSDISPFVEELRDSSMLSKLDWSDYPPMASHLNYILIKVGNQNGKDQDGTYKIRNLLKSENYRWNTKGWKAWCLTQASEGFSIKDFLKQSEWIIQANGIEIRFCDDLENIKAIYHIDNGQWHCVKDDFSTVEIR